MGLRISGSGLKELDDLAKRIDIVRGEHAVPMSDVITSSFLQTCSRFASLDELLAASGFEVNSAEDFAAIPDEQWDAFIRTSTSFANWEEMQSAAGEAWAVKQLGF